MESLQDPPLLGREQLWKQIIAREGQLQNQDNVGGHAQLNACKTESFLQKCVAYSNNTVITSMFTGLIVFFVLCHHTYFNKEEACLGDYLQCIIVSVIITCMVFWINYKYVNK